MNKSLSLIRSISLVLDEDYTMVKNSHVSLDSINADHQQRAYADENQISHYRSLIKSGKDITPVHLIPEGNKYSLVDGFHRYWAHQDEGKNEIKANVYKNLAKVPTKKKQGFASFMRSKKN